MAADGHARGLELMDTGAFFPAYHAAAAADKLSGLLVRLPYNTAYGFALPWVGACGEWWCAGKPFRPRGRIDLPW